MYQVASAANAMVAGVGAGLLTQAAFVANMIAEAGHAFERTMLYQRGSDRTTAAEVHPRAVDIGIETDDGERLAAVHVPPAPGRPVILYLHGNGECLTSRPECLRAMVAQGYGIMAPSYRGYAGSTGSPTEEGLYADARAAYDRMAEMYPGSEIAAWGFSLGTGVAIQLATERPVGRLVLEAPYTSMVDVVSNLPFPSMAGLMREEFRVEHRIGSVEAPVLVLHGRQDRIVPLDQGRRIYELATGPKKLVVFEDGGHMDLHQQGGILAALEFLGTAFDDEMATKLADRNRPFDWTTSCAYDSERKVAFHRTARARLKALAQELGLAPSSYDLRSSRGGIAVSGEIALHHDRVYIQASQSPFGVEGGTAAGLLIRTCEGRDDHVGGRNNQADLDDLDDPKALAAMVLAIAPGLRPEGDRDDADRGMGFHP